MTKANEPAYPHQEVYTDKDGYAKAETMSGLTKREKLAMEIYARYITDGEQRFTDHSLTIAADKSLRAADIFFEQLEEK